MTPPTLAAMPMEAIRRFHHDLTAIRRDLHAHLELGFEAARTAGVSGLFAALVERAMPLQDVAQLR